MRQDVAAEQHPRLSVEEKSLPVRLGQRLGPEVPALPADVLWRELAEVISVAFEKALQ